MASCVSLMKKKAHSVSTCGCFLLIAWPAANASNGQESSLNSKEF